jgi:DNA-binding MarR family transcriptional regulator
MDDRTELITRVLGCTSSLFRALHPAQNQAWQTVDLTMPQLKTLMCVAQGEATTSGTIARRLGVGLSTVTGIADRLVEQGLVGRREDPDDRRITRIVPTQRGQQLVDELLRYRDEQISALLARLSEEELKTVEQAFEYLLAAAAELDHSREAVA